MKYTKVENKYWENEESELIEFGNSFMRCFDKVGKLQLGQIYYDSKTGEKKYATRFTLDRDELCDSKEGMPYLQQTLEDWQKVYDEN